VTAQSKTSFVSGGSVRNAVQVLSQCDATIFVISMTFSLSVANDFVETPDMIANPKRECDKAWLICGEDYLVWTAL
jgi:hypothetical protein